MILPYKVQNQVKPNYIFKDAYRWYNKNEIKKIISIRAGEWLHLEGGRGLGLQDSWDGNVRGISDALFLKWCLLCTHLRTIHICVMCFSLFYSQKMF